MSILLCFGLGYCAENYVAAFGDRFDRIIGTTRRADAMQASDARTQVLAFDGVRSAELAEAIAEADAMLVSTPPTSGADPVLAVFAEAIARAEKLTSIVYLSSLGVYGDHAGAWVDETTQPAPTSMRSCARLAAETAWRWLGQQRRTSVAVLRLAGIYGPQRNAFVQLRAGTAKRVIKPGQVFGRIHVADIAAAIEAAFARQADGVFNVVDDEPAPPQDVIAFAADLIGVTRPPEIPFAEAAASMSPAALSFYAECRRTRNDRVKRELGVTLRYPTYRDGLRALLAEESSGV
jgi:nucleoside-diphosphate-sugar epimerase